MTAVDFLTGPSYEVVIAGKTKISETWQMITALQQSFHPNKVTLLRPEEEDLPAITEIAAFTEKQRSINGQPTAYVCRDYACKAPTNSAEEMLRLLEEMD
jgi:uncharacterized protein YyaL (SSP411 family)